ncbi:Yip1 family protein [Mesonia maritima]|uniref:Yip1 domain-containing protein n=1 Tax=Mesonia maritima TaxID=1793873 RepID=A0ABU1K730_9FLAO|nr:Yip1 family protein [Mesonia maritima]MDR6301426.1 hypothetical protein [Mesonia maritima]
MNNLEKIREAETKGMSKTLFYNLLFHPSSAFRYIFENKMYETTTILLILGGIVRAFNDKVQDNAGDDTSLGGILFGSILFGGLLGWIAFYIYAAILSFAGEWLGGKASGKKFRTVIGWALIPSILGLLLLIPAILVFGKDIFSSSLSSDNLAYEIFYYIFMAIYFSLQIWSLIIFIIGVKFTQKFGTFRAIINILFPAIALVLFIMLIFAVAKLPSIF